MINKREERFEKVVEWERGGWFLLEILIFVLCWIFIIIFKDKLFLRILWLIITYIAVAGMLGNFSSRKVYYRRSNDK